MDVGDVMPDWLMLDAQDKPFSFYTDSIAGNVLVVVVLAPESDGAAHVIDHLLRRANEFDRAGARLFAVALSGGRRPPDIPGALQCLLDHENRVGDSLGTAAPLPVTLVFRQNNHVAGVFDGEAGDQVSNALATAQRIHADSGTTLVQMRHPPVLLVPDVFSRDECRRLIEVFETRGQVLLQGNRAMNYIGADYKMRVPEHMREDRVDHFFFEEPTSSFLVDRLGRVIPEILKAFQYRVTRYESLRMACYEGTRAGYGHAHRDIVPPHTHRRFAMSVNLNTEEFEGGELRFPEFGDRRYRPESGAGIIFSSSLLHEALQVTAGKRFVFLAFLFGEH